MDNPANSVSETERNSFYLLSPLVLWWILLFHPYCSHHFNNKSNLRTCGSIWILPEGYLITSSASMLYHAKNNMIILKFTAAATTIPSWDNRKLLLIGSYPIIWSSFCPTKPIYTSVVYFTGMVLVVLNFASQERRCMRKQGNNTERTTTSCEHCTYVVIWYVDYSSIITLNVLLPNWRSATFTSY